jgi:hypothetical protein
MATEPLSELEIEYPDPRERREIQQLQLAAYALGVPAEMHLAARPQRLLLLSHSIGLEPTVCYVPCLETTPGNMATEPKTEDERVRAVLKHEFKILLPGMRRPTDELGKHVHRQFLVSRVIKVVPDVD